MALTFKDPPPHPSLKSVVTFEDVRIKHPGYTHSNLLLCLPATDGSGIHYATIHTVCAIITNNHFDGFLSPSASPDPSLTIDISDNDILAAGEYYFHVPNSPRYAVLSCFEDWTLPTPLPSLWIRLREQSNSTSTVQGLSGKFCALSSDDIAVQRAHIVPKTQEDWFVRNQMIIYCRGEIVPRTTGEIDAKSNLLTLRNDLHFAFDAAQFALVPKARGDKIVLVTHTLIETITLFEQYHNRPTLIPPYLISPQLLFARFAHQIFHLFKAQFFPQSIKRWVLVKIEDKFQTLLIDRTENPGFKSTSRSRSVKKRAAGNDEPNDSEISEQSDEELIKVDFVERGRTLERERAAAFKWPGHR
ncbi:hypothetical protein KVT40_001220 [Elsinoe batatas]|uniref:HNH nuclease domain-containing protein n=1 Tax=Elsinoe batatas TaxID=2601811 RepID=A0A8K0LDH9_9PEZI|nr:hypothetical protein KVT40_001220 [Elsinoe batatas]